MNVSLISSSLAALSAAGWCVYYWRRLGVRPTEVSRLIRKCVNLGACYSAFGGPRFSALGSYRLGLAAFLCAAYDFATDWRAFDAASFERFRRILYARVPCELGDIAVRLYAQELAGEVTNDGLERGVAALEFLTKVGQSHHRFRELGVVRLGTLCQILDDIMDLEADAERGELNCLLTLNRERHLRTFLAEERYLREVFGGQAAMTSVIAAAREKATALLALSALSAGPSGLVPFPPATDLAQ